METLLALYAKPYNPLEPVMCFDERPCFLIGDIVAPLPEQVSKPWKAHYAYQKLGACAVLAAIEPLTGRRLPHVRPQRRKIEFAHFMWTLSESYSDAEVIHVVLDKLNTHDISAFYEVFPADMAHALANLFCFHFTPKSASWLNMIEIEFSALSRLCLNCHIPTIGQLTTQVLAFVRDRNNKCIKINWQFSIDSARDKFHSHYERVNPLNQNLL